MLHSVETPGLPCRIGSAISNEKEIMKRGLYLLFPTGLMFLFCSCTTPWVTNTQRSAVEQYLVATAIERGVECANFKRYSGKKAFMDYEYFAPQVDKPYSQGILEMQLTKANIIITRKTDEADIIVQPLCGVLATDYSKFFIGTPQLPIPVPDTSTSFAIPEIPFFSKYARHAYGRFAFNVFDAKTRKPLESFAKVNSSATYNNWIIMLIPFSTHNMQMDDTSEATTSIQLFE